MMIRRVLCLVLAAQLLMVQGLLVRACVEQCGQAAHAGRPHVHARQLCPSVAAQERPRCPCCQRKLEQAAQKARAVEAVCDRTADADPDDAVYLPGQHVATGAGQKQAWPGDAGVAAVPCLSSAVACSTGPPPARAPVASRPPDAPVYLLTLRLLV